MQDPADKRTDEVEAAVIDACSSLYGQAFANCMKQFEHTCSRLDALEKSSPPSIYKTEDEQNKWRQRQRRKILSESRVSATLSKEIAQAGTKAALAIQEAMAEIDRINRVGDEIG